MDKENRFATAKTFMLLRLEYLVGLIVCVALAVVHIEAINWWAFVGLFIAIDLIGYIPGAVAARKSRTGRVNPLYVLMYNFTHSFIVAALIAGVWALVFGLEWALLALPIHLCGDRALFGNIIKSTVVAFEPSKHPLFARFEANLELPATTMSASNDEVNP